MKLPAIGILKSYNVDPSIREIQIILSTLPVSGASLYWYAPRESYTNYKKYKNLLNMKNYKKEKEKKNKL